MTSGIASIHPRLLRVALKARTVVSVRARGANAPARPVAVDVAVVAVGVVVVALAKAAL